MQIKNVKDELIKQKIEEIFKIEFNDKEDSKDF
jgi:hypothetical protein